MGALARHVIEGGGKPASGFLSERDQRSGRRSNLALAPSGVKPTCSTSGRTPWA